MKLRLNLSVRNTVLLSIAIATLPLLILSLVLGVEQLEETRERLLRECAATTQSVASIASADIRNTRQLLAALAALPAIRANDPEATSLILEEIASQNPQFLAMGVADPEGQVFTSKPATKRFSVADRKYFRTALATRDFAVGDFTVSRSAGRFTLHFAYPSTGANGKLLGVVWAAYDLRHFDYLFSLSHTVPGTELAIVDPHGHMVHGSGPPDTHIHEKVRADYLRKLAAHDDEGVFEHADSSGAVRLHAFHHLRLPGAPEQFLTLVVSTPVHQALAPLQLRLYSNLIVMILAAAVAAAVGWLTGEVGVIARLRKLVSLAHRLGKGDLSARSGVLDDKTDFGHLSAAFDLMAESLAARDVERLKAESATQESKERYRLILDNMSEGVAIVQDRLFQFVNPSICKICGYGRDELIGKDLADFVHPEDKDTVTTYHRRRVLGQPAPPSYEFRLIPKNGNHRWLFTSEVLIQWNGAPATLTIVTDFTERKAAETDREKLQERLRLSERMEAIGRLAGGIAHDLNNMLTPIIGYTEMAMIKAPENDTVRTHLDAILDCANRAKDLTRQILAFSRRQVLQLQVLDLNAEVQSMTRMLRPLIGENVKVESKFAPDLYKVKADASQIHQVIMNLAVNARDAMPDGGTLRLVTRNITVVMTPADVMAGPPAGDYALLEIGDTGVGMDPSTLAKIFEPFFTTKVRGKGTGLGLATVYGIVKQHDGFIYVRSSPGHGTTFSVYLPKSDVSQIQEPIPVPDAPSDSPTHQDPGTSLVLVVEDELPVRELTVAVLKQRGYTVLDADCGEEAIKVVKKHGTMPDLLVTDVIMPGMNGRELYERMSSDKRDLKVLYVSGYAANIIGEAAPGQPEPMHLQKPFSIADLARTVAKALKSGQAE